MGRNPNSGEVLGCEVPSEDRSTCVYPFVILSILTDITHTLTHTFVQLSYITRSASNVQAILIQSSTLQKITPTGHVVFGRSLSGS